MLILSNKSGQLGNRLFAFAHLIAFAEETGNKVVNMSFDEYAQYFHFTDQDVFCRYPASKSLFKQKGIRSILFIFSKIFLRVIKSLHLMRSPLHEVIVADLPEYQFKENRHFDLMTNQELISRKLLTFLIGRFFRDYVNFNKHKEKIRSYFEPTSEIRANVSNALKVIRQNAEIVVGVHIRRGDYRDFAAGKYFYEVKNYFEKMLEIETLLPNKKVVFVICSNEKIKLSEFNGLNCYLGNGHMVEDMYTLAECDLIIGPPSTFTLWSSFYGEKPLCQLRHLNDAISLESFSILPPQVLYNFSFN